MNDGQGSASHRSWSLEEWLSEDGYVPYVRYEVNEYNALSLHLACQHKDLVDLLLRSSSLFASVFPQFISRRFIGVLSYHVRLRLPVWQYVRAHTTCVLSSLWGCAAFAKYRFGKNSSRGSLARYDFCCQSGIVHIRSYYPQSASTSAGRLRLVVRANIL